MSIIDVQNSSVMNKTQPQTVNSTLQINLKDLNEISFIFEWTHSIIYIFHFSSNHFKLNYSLVLVFLQLSVFFH
jgi:hypothetical protein